MKALENLCETSKDEAQVLSALRFVTTVKIYKYQNTDFTYILIKHVCCESCLQLA